MPLGVGEKSNLPEGNEGRERQGSWKVNWDHKSEG